MGFADLPYDELHGRLIARARKLGMPVHTYGVIRYPKVAYPLIRIGNLRAASLIVVEAGLHGEERAGPLSVLVHLREMQLHAEKRGMSLVVYPCVNPSGFDSGTRYNAMDEDCNNDFMRYVRDNVLVSDLRNSTRFDSWVWSSDPMLNLGLPAETKLLHKDFRKLPFSRILGMADLHQDYFCERKLSYAYIFGSGEEYFPIARRVSRLVPLLKHSPIDSGYKPVPSEETPCTDAYGLVCRHDGGITDLFYRMGTRHCVTVETTGKVPLRTAMRVNLLWTKGIMDLAAKFRDSRGKL
ncbi:DUF2817 domain-containing protein [Candidatus Woesearchaeota archaeon]|nr:DUF2817 domain-containing protein [Candidatus Woesearchaeota archaeon]